MSVLDEDNTYFRVGLDDETMAMLIELSEACHCPPAILIASIVRGVLVDDLIAHGGAVHADQPPPNLN